MSSDWVQNELGNIELGDKRLNKRILQIVTCLCDNLGSSIVCALPDFSSVTGAYRLLKNPKTDYKKILKEHNLQTIKRMESIDDSQPILAIQDTTYIDLSSKTIADNLGFIGNLSSKGFIAHITILTTSDNVMLGVLFSKIWTRPVPEEAMTNAKRNKLPVEDKESYKWIESFSFTDQIAQEFPNKQIINIGDRDSDMFELFKVATKQDASAKLVIRANYDRKIMTEENKGYNNLWDELIKEEAKIKYPIHLPGTEKREARDTVLEIKSKSVRILPPKAFKEHANIEINAVMVREVNANILEADKVEWMLLTTLPIDTADQIKNVVENYKSRWLIEVYFRLLKSVCKVENHNFSEINTYLACISIKIICAWRVMYMMKICKTYPDTNPDNVFSKDEQEIIKKVNKKKSLKSAREYIRALASLGGFLGRKSDGEPGYVYISQGLVALSFMKKLWIEMKG